MEGQRKSTVQRIVDEKIAKEEEKREKKAAAGKDGDEEYDLMDVDGGGSTRNTRSSGKGFWKSVGGR